MYQGLSSLLPIKFDFNMASSIENFGGAEGYPPHYVEKVSLNLCVPRVSSSLA